MRGVFQKLALLTGLTLALTGPAFAAGSGPDTSVYFGGDILTMVGTQPHYVEALVVRDGQIVLAGSRAQAERVLGPDARPVDLKGKTLLPGFIDAHSHLLGYADGLMRANLAPAPVGHVARIADLVREMQALKVRLKAAPGDWLIGRGYDQDFLAEGRHPTAADLDTAFPDNPVLLVHVSGHMLVANTAALRAAGVTAATPDSAGGMILRKPGTTEPAGLVQELAMAPFSAFMRAPRKPEVDLALIGQAIEAYAANGYTTAGEHLLMPDKRPLLEQAADQGLLKIDLIALPTYLAAPQLVGTGAIAWGNYRKGLKYGGLKISADGSPQGKTAFLTRPYLTPVPGCAADCHGFPNISQAALNDLLVLAYSHKVQIFAHSNGDATVDMMIAAHKAAEARLGVIDTDRRTIIIHSQIIRPDQLASYKQLGLIPSFFTNHTFYWGDVHTANLGLDRSAYISPMASAFKLGIKATNHTDSPVTPLNPLFVLWTSVNRQTRSGQVLGPDERLTAYQGLQALTVNGAWEFHEEASKGSLEAGKLADLVILDKNPLKVPAPALKDIQVVETLKAGQRVFPVPTLPN